MHLNYWDLLGYSEALLVNAHKMNPRSRYRSHTLFSTIMGIRKSSGLGEMPDIKAAYRYAEEFPDGTFIKETLAIIAGFHKDLFMTLRDVLRDYKYDCYKPYIDDSSRLDQMDKAKNKAIESYEKLLTVDPSNERAKSVLKEVRNGTVRAWSFCAD